MLVALLFLLLFFLLALARPAHAQAWLEGNEARFEDRLADGDIDREDLARLPGLAMGRERSAGKGALAQTWVSLVGFSRQSTSGLNEVGGFVVVGLALDKIAQGRARVDVRPSFADGAAPRTPAPRPEPPRLAPPSLAPPSLAIDAPLARGAVRSAWRASGIEVNDAKIDSMIARSRLSAILPETRLRVMQVLQDGEHTTSYVDEAGTVVDTSGATTTVEARLTWRFDRLLFADDEPTLERVRLEREEARSRIGSRVLELLFTWQRAMLDAAGSDAGSRAELDATLRQYEAEISLDVLTGGWFGAQPLVRAHRPGPMTR
jgi:hypothetical protein